MLKPEKLARITQMGDIGDYFFVCFDLSLSTAG